MNNSSAIPPVGGPPPPGGVSTMVLVISVLQVVMTMVIICGNLLVIVAVSKFRRLRTVTSTFVVNLAIADLLLGLCLPYQMLANFLPSIDSHPVGCLYRYCLIIFCSTSSLLCLFITVLERYMAICHPFQYLSIMSNNVICILIITSWLYAFLLAHLPLFGWNSWTFGLFCIYQLVVTKAYIMTVALHFMALSVLIFVLYCHIFCIARKQRMKIAAEQAQGSSHTQPATQMNFVRNAKSTKLMALVFLSFNICWLPFCIIQVSLIIRFDMTLMILSNFAVFFGILSSAMNPFIYALKNREYRQSFKRLACYWQGQQDDTNSQ